MAYNPEQAKKEVESREAIIASLREKMKQGDRSLIGNKGKRAMDGRAGVSYREERNGNATDLL